MKGNSMKYEIRIGEIVNLTTLAKEPKRVITISAEQLEIVKAFADVTKDEDLNDVYRLNACTFTVSPHFDVEEIKVEDFKN